MDSSSTIEAGGIAGEGTAAGKKEKPWWPVEADRAVGVLLGAMCGDVLGAMPEGLHLTAHDIETQFPRGLRDFVPGHHLGLPHDEPPRTGRYTDDTNSVLALATSLVSRGGLDPQHIARAYVAFWLHEPVRGYPDSAVVALACVAAGGDITKVGRLAFPDGSYANGAAMRIAPVGVAFRNATNAELRLAVRSAVISSHVHPEAVDAAVVLAKSISFLLKTTPDEFKPTQFLSEIFKVCHTEQMKGKVSMLAKHLGGGMWPAIVWILPEQDEQGREVPEKEEHHHKRRRCFQIRGTSAVATALWAFLSHWRSPEDVVVTAVGIGGDADTIGSMAGALVGALHGTAWIPTRWFDSLENDTKWGRDFAIATSERLSRLDLHRPLPGCELELPDEEIDKETARKLRQEIMADKGVRRMLSDVLPENVKEDVRELMKDFVL